MRIEVLTQLLVGPTHVGVRVELARNVEERCEVVSLQILRRFPLPLVHVGVLEVLQVVALIGRKRLGRIVCRHIRISLHWVEATATVVVITANCRRQQRHQH